jgi:hypothetical protein
VLIGGATVRISVLAVFLGVAAVGVVAVSVAASQFNPVRPDAQRLVVPTSEEIVGDSSVPFEQGGTVYAARHGALVCFYLNDAKGDALVFPTGYTASEDLRLRDSERRVVASPGFAVAIAFGDAEVKVPAECGTDRPSRAVVRIHGAGD